MSLLKCLIISAIVCSCNQADKENKEIKKKSVKLNLRNVNPVNIIDTTITYNKANILNQYVKEFTDSLSKNKIPDFFIDECLDASSMGYCRVSSHETISLRTDIVKKFKKEDIKKILSIGDKEKLKRKCKTDFTSELFNSNKSTYDILMEANH
jgi:hypothetical protein